MSDQLDPGDLAQAPETITAKSLSIRGEACRGAKYGAVVAGSIMIAVLVLIGGPIALVAYINAGPAARARYPVGVVDIIKGIGGMLGGIGLAALYGAVIGGACMGLAALVKRKRI